MGEYPEDFLWYASNSEGLEFSISVDSIQDRLDDLLLLETEICEQIETNRSRDVTRGRGIIDDYCDVNDFALDGCDSVTKGARKRVDSIREFVDKIRATGSFARMLKGLSMKSEIEK